MKPGLLNCILAQVLKKKIVFENGQNCGPEARSRSRARARDMTLYLSNRYSNQLDILRDVQNYYFRMTLKILDQKSKNSSFFAIFSDFLIFENFLRIFWQFYVIRPTS